MDKNSNAYTVVFAVGVCAVLAVCLAAVYNGLKDSIESNELFDRQKNILIAVGLYDKQKDAGKSRQELEQLLDKYIRSEVLQVRREVVPEEVKRGGEKVTERVERVVGLEKTDYEVSDLKNLRRDEARKKDRSKRREFTTFYRRVDEQGKDVAYCIPISGYGLWSTLYGFLALKPDLNQVQGITFYKHAETPGLGGEVDNPSWQAQWRSKKIRDDQGKLVSVVVKKGMVDPNVAFERDHMVDGLSGATITSNGVTRFLRKDLETYEPYFQEIRGK